MSESVKTRRMRAALDALRASEEKMRRFADTYDWTVNGTRARLYRNGWDTDYDTFWAWARLGSRFDQALDRIRPTEFLIRRFFKGVPKEGIEGAPGWGRRGLLKTLQMAGWDIGDGQMQEFLKDDAAAPPELVEWVERIADKLCAEPIHPKMKAWVDNLPPELRKSLLQYCTEQWVDEHNGPPPPPPQPEWTKPAADAERPQRFERRPRAIEGYSR